MPSPKWKQFERDIATFAGGKRQGSRGVAEADVVVGKDDEPGYTFECKSREDVPKWLLDAFNQSAVNARMYPLKDNFVALGAHFGRGKPIRVIIAKEVVLKDDDFERVSALFKRLLARLIPNAGQEETVAA